MFRIPHIRAVTTDKRLGPIAFEAVLAKTSLNRLTRLAVRDAFTETGLLSDGQMQAAAVVDGHGRYSVPSIDSALEKCPMLKSHDRIEIKGVLARHALLR
jgi:hypothetical protein